MSDVKSFLVSLKNGVLAYIKPFEGKHLTHTWVIPFVFHKHMDTYVHCTLSTVSGRASTTLSPDGELKYQINLNITEQETRSSRPAAHAGRLYYFNTFVFLL